MRSTTTLLLVAAAVTFLAGCTGWYSRYFERTDNSLQCTGKYCFSPRVVSYKDEFGEPDTYGEHGYWISIKVYDTSVVQPKDIWKEDQKTVRTGLADVFQDRLVKLIRFDSLVLRLSPQNTTIAVKPDTARYTPRDIDYISYNFGKVIIPRETGGLMAVFHYQIIDESAALPSPDSVLFDMVRIEEREAIPALRGLVGQPGGTRDKKEQETDD